MNYNYGGTNNPKEMTFYLAGGIIVKPIAYDKSSGEVSYVTLNNSSVHTCFLSDINSVNGFTYIMEYLNSLPERKLEPAPNM